MTENEGPVFHRNQDRNVSLFKKTANFSNSPIVLDHYLV